MYTYKVTNVKHVDDVIIITAVPVGKKLDYRAGQFTSIFCPEKNISRFYSIASSPNEHIEFIVKITGGEMTTHLSKINEGDVLLLGEAQGKFSIEGKQHVCFFAAGVGIAPMISMIREVHNKRYSGRFILFYSNRTKKIPYFEELRNIEKENKNIKVVFTVTRENVEGLERGRIDEKMVRKHLADLKGYDVFVCGQSEFGEQMNKIARGMGARSVEMEVW